MHCPNCHHILTKIMMDAIEVDHCNFCGATLFDINEINRITLSDARKLAEMKKSDVISGEEKLSPRDGSPLVRMQDDSIPQFVTLLHSTTTGEVFAFPDDLVSFKKAQNAKISYFKSWHIPLPALQSVLVYSLILVTTLSVVYLSNRFQTPTSHTTQATSLCINKNIVEQTEGGYLVFCETKSPLNCAVRSACPDGEKITPLKSDANRTSHYEVLPPACTNIKIECSEGSSSIETDWMLLPSGE